MFTGIIEGIGKILKTEKEKGNLHLHISAPFIHELKIDQSIAHNGVCLTVVALSESEYVVTAIKETLEKTNLGRLTAGDEVNLERCMQLGARLDGHIVQGHVDQTAICTAIKEENGSWKFTFEYDSSTGNVTVQKGSICVNGVSLTVVDPGSHSFSVAIIPYTFENTSFKNIKVGDPVNLEFDIIGKYVARMMERNS